MLTMKNNSALVKGAQNNEEVMAKKKFINSGEFSYGIGGKTILPGEIFESESNVHISQVIGAGNAVELTKENEKELLAKYAKKKS